MLQLPNEEILVYTNEHQVVLTDHRIQMSERGLGESDVDEFINNVLAAKQKRIERLNRMD